MTHLAAATPHLTYACDTHYPWLEEDLLVGGKTPIRDGSVAVPTGPGLGIEIDEGKVARMAEEYVRCGTTRRNDVEEMRKRVPDWQPLRPRW